MLQLAGNRCRPDCGRLVSLHGPASTGSRPHNDGGHPAEPPVRRVAFRIAPFQIAPFHGVDPDWRL
jgi:hypothetical protein